MNNFSATLDSISSGQTISSAFVGQARARLAVLKDFSRSQSMPTLYYRFIEAQRHRRSRNYRVSLEGYGFG